MTFQLLDLLHYFAIAHEKMWWIARNWTFRQGCPEAIFDCKYCHGHCACITIFRMGSPVNSACHFEWHRYKKYPAKYYHLWWPRYSLYSYWLMLADELVKFILYIVSLTLMLLVPNLANTKWCKNPENLLKPWHMCTHLRVLSESYPMNTNMTGFRWFSKLFASLCFGRK